MGLGSNNSMQRMNYLLPLLGNKNMKRREEAGEEEGS